MRQFSRALCIVGASTLVASCAIEDGGTTKTGKAIAEPLTLTSATKVTTEGILDYGTVVFAENPTTLLEANDFHGYEFDGKAGGIVTITANGAACLAPDTILDLFGPADAHGNRGTSLAENDDAFIGSCLFDSQITSFRLPVDGRYLIVVTSFLQAGGGHYKLQMTCDNNLCALPGAPTFHGSKIAQTDIDKGLFTPEQLFDIGDFTFETIFRVEDGMGNALNGAPAGTSPRPNFRQIPNNVHFAAFGAPEAQSCVTCHNVGGDDGGGDLNHNIFQIGDGINRSSGVPRNAPAVLGTGWRQQIGIEMTNDLKAQLAAAKAAAAAGGAAVTQALSSKGTSFGSIVVNPDGTVNFAGLAGVDTDLVVKPFGWKGREATIRRFIEGGFRVHFGMQTSPSIAKHCANPNVNTFGNGPDCHDPDGDGVIDEIPEGLLTAEAVYMGLRETPIRLPALTAAGQARVNNGEALFASVGCVSCHTTRMTLNNPVHVEPADTTGGAGITYNLSVDGHDPKPAPAASGAVAVELWSDFKRHDVGTALADSKNFNQIAANQFITPPLWGVADTAPYLHDGRAATLADAILQHAGDALAVRNAYAALTADQQLQIQEFLGRLGRNEDPKLRQFVSTDVPKAIPDNNATGVSSVINVPAGLDVQGVTVTTNINHTYRGDLVIQVVAPNGQVATLSNRQGGSAQNFVATNLDISSSFTAGSSASGQWRLFVRDLAAIDVGTITSFSLTISSSR
jgi:subtilisin-like proprotein convertase family protein